jgi:anhydro-N-acetylmuramic acid kinase
MPAELYVGLMSGTSLDGIDATLVDFGHEGIRLVATSYHPFPTDVRAAALELQTPGNDELNRAALLGTRLAQLYGDAVRHLLRQKRINPEQIRAIGCHGQTVRHVPSAGYSAQIVNSSLLAELTGISVVSDFRSRDIASGGQGAPLVPAFHDVLFRSPSVYRAILNIGGFSNLTLLPPDKLASGFDTGPGNVLLDYWSARHHGTAFDAGGAWATEGSVNKHLLAKMLEHPFFLLPPPKSCGREQFNATWLESHLDGNYAPADTQRTLVELTSQSIIRALCALDGAPDEIYVCGGGAHNGCLMDSLQRGLPKSRWGTTNDLGLHVDWVESVAFAWLARRAIRNEPGNLPNVTGAKGARVLGSITPA